MGNYKQTKFHKLDHSKILSEFKELNNVRGVARLNNISTDLVEKILTHHNIPLPVKIWVKDLNPTPIVKRYLESRNSSEVAQEFSISVSSLHQILHNNNIKISKIRYTEQEIIDHYYKVKTLVKTCEDLNISDGYLREILVKNNVPLQALKRVNVGNVYDYLTVIKELQPKYTTGGESKKNVTM